MDWKNDWKALSTTVALFLMVFYLPVESMRLQGAPLEALHLLKWYAREHVVLCLLPAFLIAGAIGVFVSKASVMKYLGAEANKVLAYCVASISGGILAVCSCTILPLFAGIYRMGAGLGPATAFLYAGPAINVLAIILTARILGLELGIARAIGAVVFSIVIGLLMHLLFRNDNEDKIDAKAQMPDSDSSRSLGQNAIYFALMIAILIFANWGRPDQATGLWHTLFSSKWIITSIASALLAVILMLWFGLAAWKLLVVGAATIALAFAIPDQPVIAFAAGLLGLSAAALTTRGEASEWIDQSWGFAKQILPLLLIGVLVAGLLLGRPGEEGLIPSEWITASVGGNSIRANLFASVVGAFMYFATLTEVPILQGLIGNGMGKGPALALLLAGPALSLPNMLVIRSVIGTKKTAVFTALVVFMATISGIIYGSLFG